MNRAALSVFVLFLAASASAQETYSLPASAGNVTTLTGVITAQNGDLCNRAGLARTCTQAQVCTARGVAGGASCTAAQARGAKARVFPITQAGREEFVIFELTAPKFVEIVATVREDQKREFCERWAVSNATARNNACTDIGASAGCDPACTP